MPRMFQMRPMVKRSAIAADSTGRRYFTVYTSTRPAGRRYYVCSRPDCETRVARDADLFCRAHSESNAIENDVSTKSEDVSESLLNDHSEIIDEDNPLKEPSEPNFSLDENGHDVEVADFIAVNELNDMDDTSPMESSALARERARINREVLVDERTGGRTFRDSAGRLRHLCTHSDCTSMLKRQTDIFCRIHIPGAIGDESNRETYSRYSAPASSAHARERPSFTNSIATLAIQNGTNGNHSEEYESPEKVQDRPGTKRSFRDGSGRIRFLCSVPTCRSRVHRQAETFCRRHQRDFESQKFESISQFIIANVGLNYNPEENGMRNTDLNHNNTDTSIRQSLPEPSPKRRKYASYTPPSKSLNLSSISTAKIVLSTTTLLDDQWTDILTFLRRFPQVQFSTNLVVNDSTTHLLIDDSDKPLHCTITKKIVQAAVRRHIFIISARWVRECLRANQFVDEHAYEILSDSHTTLRLSMQNFEHDTQYLLNAKYGFAIECRQCQGSINRNELSELIELTGAQVYDHDQTVETLIVLCDTNEKNLTKIKEKYLTSNASTTKYVTSDFLLKSIIKFEIQDMDKYSL